MICILGAPFDKIETISHFNGFIFNIYLIVLDSDVMQHLLNLLSVQNYKIYVRSFLTIDIFTRPLLCIDINCYTKYMYMYFIGLLVKKRPTYQEAVIGKIFAFHVFEILV